MPRKKTKVSTIEHDNSNEFDIEPNDLPKKTPTVWEKIKQIDFGNIFSLKNIVQNFKDSPYTCGTLVGAAGLISAGSIIYAKRTAHMIHLLPDKQIRFTFFSPLGLGRPPSIEVPTTDVACISGRATATNFCILKLRGHYGYHLVSKKDGEFIDSELFDQHLGYSRSWLK